MELIEMELEDYTDPSLKKIKGNIAELTRPARDLKGKRYMIRIGSLKVRNRKTNPEQPNTTIG
jgi:hypothetical protein